MAPCNLVLYNKRPSLIDLEGFWEIKNFEKIKDKVKKKPPVSGPKQYRDFIEKEYNIWLKEKHR